MSTTQQEVLALLDELIVEASGVMSTTWLDEYDGHIRVMNPSRYVDSDRFCNLNEKCKTLGILLGDRIKPWESQLCISLGNSESNASRMLSALKGLRFAIERGLLTSIQQLVLAETFSDLLEQAEYLQKEGYSLAAGVLGRAVLEEHLRKLCELHNCLPAKPKPTIEHYKSELYQNQHIDKMTMKNVEFMAAVGNTAAHNLPGFKSEDVPKLLRDLQEFVLRNPLT